MMSAEVCQGLAERLSILQNCHLASDSDDNTAGAIHWYEGIYIILTTGWLIPFSRRWAMGFL